MGQTGARARSAAASRSAIGRGGFAPVYPVVGSERLTPARRPRPSQSRKFRREAHVLHHVEGGPTSAPQVAHVPGGRAASRFSRARSSWCSCCRQRHERTRPSRRGPRSTTFSTPQSQTQLVGTLLRPRPKLPGGLLRHHEAAVPLPGHNGRRGEPARRARPRPPASRSRRRARRPLPAPHPDRRRPHAWTRCGSCPPPRGESPGPSARHAT